MTPRELVAGARVTALVGSPEMDPLTEDDALREAQLNEALLDAKNMRACPAAVRAMATNLTRPRKLT